MRCCLPEITGADAALGALHQFTEPEQITPQQNREPSEGQNREPLHIVINRMASADIITQLYYYIITLLNA
jgi:hypothetical protein